MDAARTARRLGAEEALIIYRRDRAHMPAHAFEADEAIAEGVKIKWLTSIKRNRRPDADGRADGTGRQGPAAADRGVRDAGGRRRRAGARPADRQRLPAANSRRRIQTGRHRGGRPADDDRPSRAVRRRRHGAGRAHGHRSPSATASRRRATSMHGCAAQVYDAPAPPPVVGFDMLHLPVFSDVDPAAQQQLARSTGSPVSKRSWRASARRGAPRGATMPVLRQTASSATIASRPVRRTRSSSSARATATGSN